MPTVGEIRKASEIGFKASNGEGKMLFHACIDCGKERWTPLIRGNPNRLRCLGCAARRRPKRFGADNNAWKGGRSLACGYPIVKLLPDDFFYPMSHNGYIKEHRLIVARALGRCLLPWEIVHHRGAKYPKGSKENRADNRYPENLQLVSDIRHQQITILENKIQKLERRMTLLEAENIRLETLLSNQDFHEERLLRGRAVD